MPDTILFVGVENALQFIAGQNLQILSNQSAMQNSIANLTTLVQQGVTMDAQTQQEVAQLASDFTTIATGIQSIKDAGTAALAAKDATIADLTAKLAAETTLDASDKQALADLQAKDAQAATDFQNAITPVVAQADSLAQSFATTTQTPPPGTVAPVLDPVTGQPVQTPIV